MLSQIKNYSKVKLYNPNQKGGQFIKQEKDLAKNLVKAPRAIATKSLEMFMLNGFLRNISPNQHIQAILQRIYGIGQTRAFLLSLNITYFQDSISFKNLTFSHQDLLSDLFDELKYTLQNWLKNIKKTNISTYKLINCYKGVRHSLYLPVRGQRTHSNAHVARYLGSGTFEYVPQGPSTKLKKLSKYSRRKVFLVDASNARYNRLLNKNYVEFAKKNKKLFKHLLKKNKLGVFGKLYKEKTKLAKIKAKKSKK